MLKVIAPLLLFVTPLYAADIKVNPELMTKAHNELRKKYNSPPLAYSNALAKVAAKWAKELQFRGCHISHSYGETGENIYWASPRTVIKTNRKNKKTRTHSLQKITEKKVVQSWYDEVKWYNYDTNSCQNGKICGHYTQVIWNTTKELGCAAVACEDFSQAWVCEYAPPGNVNMRRRDGTIKRLKPY